MPTAVLKEKKKKDTYQSNNQFQKAARTGLPSQEEPVSLGAEAKAQKQRVLPKLARIWHWVRGGQVQHSLEMCEVCEGSRKSTQDSNQPSPLLPAAAAGTHGHFPSSPLQQCKALRKTYPEPLAAVLLTTIGIPNRDIRGVADPALLPRFSEYGRKQSGKKHKWKHDSVSPKLYKYKGD